ncbi:hypothetical protein EDF83_0598 [Pseudomonas protegens]|uniref:hypothetical protein n=1 Tax=Pseudomonas TaxID=286 RepID=UPI000F97107A|nr:MULTISPECIES: hypothetical protein [Pseudomonas]MCS4261094.1 dihydroorotase-like cyclic amidohydrolase [Pseudomonas sp. BIGb0176]ROQ61342.1 hypothetical protein EDF83_0598 [Pseudomonas protegens]ROQ83660.1 hypothetical protein EC837_0515 [Pseudomonas protegens]WRV93697.1 hypothetical protein VP719_11785 [Pseudomonas protegens]
MAAKVEYVVVDGCIQDGSQIVKKGDVYDPPNTEVRDLLLEEGKIAKRGKLDAEQPGDD